MDQFNKSQNDKIEQQIQYNNVNEPFDDQPDRFPVGVPPKKIVSYAGFALFILAVVVLGVQAVIEYFVQNYYPSLSESDWYVWVVTAVSLELIGFPIYYLLIRKIPDSPKGEAVKLKPLTFFGIFFICTAGMYITNFFSTILNFMISAIKGEELLNPVAEAIMDGNFVVTLIYAAVIAPIFEELIFRKLLLDKLRRFGDIPAILMTGFAFGLFHLNLSQFFYAAVLGFIFAYVTLRTNTVKYAIVLHMMINFIAAIMTPLVSNGNMLGYLAIYLWVVVAMTLGIVLFILNYKKIRLRRTVPVMKLSSYVFNLGTMLYIIVCLVIIAFVTIG